MTAPNDAPVGKAGIRSQAFSLADRLQSFRYAATGIGSCSATSTTPGFHLSISVAVCLTAWWFKVSAADWRWLVVAIVLVWVAEAMNTAFEYVCDVISPEFHVSVEKAKDIAAGAVLICSGGAAVLGLLTFWPYVWR